EGGGWAPRRDGKRTHPASMQICKTNPNPAENRQNGRETAISHPPAKPGTASGASGRFAGSDPFRRNEPNLRGKLRISGGPPGSRRPQAARPRKFSGAKRTRLGFAERPLAAEGRRGDSGQVA